MSKIEGQSFQSFLKIIRPKFAVQIVLQRKSITMSVGVSIIVRFPLNSGVQGGEICFGFMLILDYHVVIFFDAIDQIWIVIQQLQEF